MRELDLHSNLLKVSHDPTNLLAIDPASLIGGQVGSLADVLMQLPKLAIDALIKLLTDPLGAIEALLEQFPGVPFEDILPWLQALPSIGEIVQAITGVVGGTIEHIAQFFANLEAFLGSIDFLDPVFDAFEAIGDFIQSILMPSGLLLGPTSPINAGQIIGRLLPRLIPQIGIGALGDIQPNLLLENTFDESITIDPNTDFYWDGTDGKTTPGCAAVNCDGVEHFLISEKIPVAKDQQLNIGAYIAYAGIGAGSNPISVEILTFGDTDGNVVIDTLASAAVDDTDWSVELSGDWTVPDGVDEVAILLRVTAAATAGVAKFDDCWVKKVQKLPIPWVAELPTTLSEAAQKVKDIIDRIFNGWANLGELIDLDRGLQDVLDAITGLLGIGLGAKADTAAVEARVRALESSASTIIDDFARGSSTNLGANYAVRNVSGGGAGSIGLDGRGNCVWRPSGVGNRTQYARRTDMTVPSDNFIFRVVFSSNPQSYIFDDAYTYLLARLNTASNSCVRLRMGWGTANLQMVVSDTVTNLGSTASITSAMAGKTLEWQGGEAGGLNKRHFTVKLDNELIIDTTDSGNISQVGASYLSVGVGMETGNRLVFNQNIPSGLAFYSVAELA